MHSKMISRPHFLCRTLIIEKFDCRLSVARSTPPTESTVDPHPPVSPRKKKQLLYFAVYEVGMGVGIRKKWGGRHNLVNILCLSQRTQLEVHSLFRHHPNLWEEHS